MPKPIRERTKITEEDLYKTNYITAQMAADYLGNAMSAQGARVLARAGKIGEPIPGTRRVYIQAGKLIEFKYGKESPDKRYEAMVRAFKEEGLTDLATELAVAIVKLAEKAGQAKEGLT